MARTRTTKPTELCFMKVTEDAKAPFKATDEAACFDLYANETVRLYPQRGQDKAYLVPTGVKLFIPEGYHVQIYMRSSIGLKTKLRLANGTGIIDSDYTGEAMLLMENIGTMPYTINKGERVAQMLLVKNEPCELVEVSEDTKDGSHGGFGSTGKD